MVNILKSNYFLFYVYTLQSDRFCPSIHVFSMCLWCSLDMHRSSRVRSYLCMYIVGVFVYMLFLFPTQKSSPSTYFCRVVGLRFVDMHLNAHKIFSVVGANMTVVAPLTKGMIGEVDCVKLYVFSRKKPLVLLKK